MKPRMLGLSRLASVLTPLLVTAFVIIGGPSQAVSPVSWLNNSLFAPVPGLGNLNDGLYADFTKGTLVPERGPTFGNVRATGSSTVDNEGLVRTIQSGEARFWRLRRVEQLLANPENLNGAGWTKQAGATVTQISGSEWEVDLSATAVGQGVFVQPPSAITSGNSWRASISLKVMSASGDNTVQIAEPAGARFTAFTATLTTGWQRIAAPNVTSAASESNGIWVQRRTGGATVFRLKEPQVETNTGQAIQTPSEYVSKGVLSSPWHGAGVDGVRYFNTANGNTVASNVVTEATGAPLTVTSSGIWPNGAHTNICLQSEDFGTTWAALAATSPTRVAANVRLGDLVLDLIGDDSAVLAEGYTQTITFTGDAVKAVSIHMKAGSATNSLIRLRDDTGLANRLLASIAWSGGVPTVTMTTGTLESTETLANGVYRFNFTTTSVTAANTNRLEVYPASNAALDVTATGTVNAGGVMAQDATTNGRYVKTTTASVAVNADVITASGATVINQTEGTLWVEAIGPASLNAHAFNIDDGTNNERFNLFVDSARQSGFFVADGGAAQVALASVATVSAGAAFKHAGRYRLNDSNHALSGVANTADAVCTMPTTTTLRLGGNPTGSEFGAPIRKVALSRTGASDANLAVATTP